MVFASSPYTNVIKHPPGSSQLIQASAPYLHGREHLAYFRIFVRAFAENGDGPLNVPGRPRPNDDPCPTCGFRLGTPDATFCVVCGHYDTALKDRHSKKEQEEGKGT